MLTDVPNVAFKVSNFDRTNMATIENRWPDISRALMLTVQMLASWGCSRDTLASQNAIIPLAYYILQGGNPTRVVQSPGWQSEREAMRRWLMTALLKRKFSGQADNVLRRIRQVLQESHDGFPMPAIVDSLRPTAKSMTMDEAQPVSRMTP